MGFNYLKARGHFEEALNFLPLSYQKLSVLILSTSERWKAESTLEPPSRFEHGTPGLGIQRLNYQAIAPWMDYCPASFMSVVSKTFEKLVINV